MYSGKKMRLTSATDQTSEEKRQLLARRPAIENLSEPGQQAGKKGFFNRLFGR